MGIELVGIVETIGEDELIDRLVDDYRESLEGGYSSQALADEYSGRFPPCSVEYVELGSGEGEYRITDGE